MPARLADKSLVFKIVYFGPELSGKTTSIKWIHDKEIGIQTSNLISIKGSETTDTTFFDRMMAKVGPVQYQVWSVRSSKNFEALQKAILGGCDGIIFVFDASKEKWKDNLAAINVLIAILGKKLNLMPLICMFNKADLPEDQIVKRKDAENIFNKAKLKVQFLDTVAIDGINVKNAFTHCAKSILENYINK